MTSTPRVFAAILTLAALCLAGCGSSGSTASGAGDATDFVADDTFADAAIGEIWVDDSGPLPQQVRPDLTLYDGDALHVLAGASGSAADGSAANPFPSIQAAVDAAGDKQLIVVAEGTYNETLVLPSARSLRLAGSYSADFTTRSLDDHLTRIVGTAGASVVSLVFEEGPGAQGILLLDGFALSGGHRGLFVENVGNGGELEVTVINNTLENNKGLVGSGDFGGGLYLSGASCDVQWNVIQNNECGKGAGVMILLRDSFRTFRLSNNAIMGNKARSDHGGGVYIAAGSGTVAFNQILNNSVEEEWGWGGGMIIDGATASDLNGDTIVELVGNLYRGNSSPGSGSALFVDEGANVVASNELIVGNVVREGGRSGAVYVDGPQGSAGVKTVLRQCTIADNIGGADSSGHAVVAEDKSVVQLVNCILWGNSAAGDRAQLQTASGAAIAVAWSLCDGGCQGSGNLESDPLFAGGGDYHLRSKGGRWLAGEWIVDQEQSPAIDAGDASSPFDMEPLPNGGRANMGAYGNTEQASKSLGTL